MGNSNSTVEFRGLVQAIVEDDVPVDSSAWDKFWVLPTSTTEVFGMLQPSEVRELLDKRPEKLQTLALKGLKQIDIALEESPLSKETIHKCLNAVRILTRIIPFLLEKRLDPFVESMLWDANSFNGESRFGQALVDRIGKLLFLPGLCISPLCSKPCISHSPGVSIPSSTKAATESNSEEEDDEDTDDQEESENFTSMELRWARREIMWSEGLGTVEPLPHGYSTCYPDATSSEPRVDRSLNKNRTEVLRLLLVCQSGILFTKPSECKPEQNKWVRAISLVDNQGRKGIPFARELFCSLMNQVCSYDPVGWGIPYGSSIHSGSDEENFTDVCLHNLLLLLEVNSPANIFRQFLNQLETEEEFDFAYSNIARLLRNVPEAENTYLPGSAKRLESYQELLVLLWKLLDSNKAFMTYVLEVRDITDIVLPTCFFLWNGRRNPSQVGLVHICTFLILLLSGERSFGVSLNKAFDQGSLFLKGAPKMTQPNHGDLLVLVFSKIIFDGDRQLKTLYNCFLTILSNISPYIKSFGQRASMNLLSLFEKFSSRRFLFREENNHQYLFFLLDIFNNVIQYQYEGNVQLVYTICVHEKAFRALASMEFEEHFEFTPPLPQPSNKTTPDEHVALNAEHGPSESEQQHHPLFEPTEEWFVAWRTKLPLSTIIRLLDILVPRVQKMCQREDGTTLRDKDIYDFLRKSTMVGLLPVPHPIVIRRYQPNQYTTLWFTTYTWGVIYLRNQELPIWDAGKIRLFRINLKREA